MLPPPHTPHTIIYPTNTTGVEVRTYDIIYNLLDDVRAAMEGRLKSVEERIYVGTAEIKAVFGAGNKKVAGCVVTDGVIKVDAVAQVFFFVGFVVWACACVCAHAHMSMYTFVKILRLVCTLLCFNSRCTLYTHHHHDHHIVNIPQHHTGDAWQACGI